MTTLPPTDTLCPHDKFNDELESQVHPPDWINPTPRQPYHLIVIGGGTAGLVTAAGAAGLGARVALVERKLMGGDCLNVGCVPSKALIAAARSAVATRMATQFGIHLASEPDVDFPAVMERMRRLRASISPADSAARFQKLGVDVYFGTARFRDNETIEVAAEGSNQRELIFRKAVIATGAKAAVPPIPGLDTVTYLTNENLFSLTERPKRLGVIGGGPIGAEMAQTFAQLGSQVTLFDRDSRILGRDDAAAAEVVQAHMERDGVQFILNSSDMEISRSSAGESDHRSGGEIRVTGKQSSRAYDLTVDQLLLSAGRTPNTDGLGLEQVHVDFDDKGVQVNDYLQTTNHKIYAAGDICTKYKFTHHADFQARIVIQNALFSLGPFGKKKASDLLVPWATYTSPELAQVGLNELTAKASGTEIDTYTQQFADVDRAILDGQTEGFVKIHTKKGSDKIAGATICAHQAGDLISEITLAMNAGFGLSKIASTIHPYPTVAEAIRKLGDQFNKTKLTPFSQRMLNVLRWLNVGA